MGQGVGDLPRVPSRGGGARRHHVRRGHLRVREGPAVRRRARRVQTDATRGCGCQRHHVQLRARRVRQGGAVRRRPRGVRVDARRGYQAGQALVRGGDWRVRGGWQG